MVFILGSGSLDSIENVDGKAGPYGPGIPNRNLTSHAENGLGQTNSRKTEHDLFSGTSNTLREGKTWCGSRQLKEILNMQFSIL